MHVVSEQLEHVAYRFSCMFGKGEEEGGDEKGEEGEGAGGEGRGWREEDECFGGA